MLKDCIRRDMFDDVVRRVQSLLKTKVSDSCRPQQGIPSLTMNLGYNHKSCANIMLCCAIKKSRKCNAMISVTGSSSVV